MRYGGCEGCGEPVILDDSGVLHDDLIFHDECFEPCQEKCDICDNDGYRNPSCPECKYPFAFEVKAGSYRCRAPRCGHQFRELPLLNTPQSQTK
jgi:hypothetical protein